ncbi:glycoside hydrolase family 99-like domain-containing protein [Terricaulis sp.]|uniref:glycoside hydrolase family 99-like domain-containing protein n=1 Tax=Terricaulis sp. TaxID=2768686 RepID=UPI0037847996
MAAVALALHLGELADLTSDGAAALPILRVTGSAPRAALVSDAGEAVGLAPGEYFIEVRARGLDGALAPHLLAALAGGGSRREAPSEVEPGVWRYALSTDRSIEGLSLALDGAQALIFAGGSIITEGGDIEPAPTFRGAFVTAGRATFRALPQSTRRALLSSSRRAAWMTRVRKSEQGGSGAPAAGAFTSGGGEADALRADFDNRMGVARGLKDAAFSDDAPPLSPRDDGVKLVAFHLPQFHPIPENDAWWGPGFTEWSNVARAQPQFLGHYQPRLPGELGFYDLRTPGVLARQAALARQYGVGAFAFHYYWFAGKRLLEAPLDAFVADKSIDIEFCLCWANENWTRRWDGDEHDVLIAQNHTMEDHARVFADLARYMGDPRYLRIDGKPLLIVYRPEIIANAAEMTTLWRREAEKQGWPGVYLVASSAFRFDAPQRLGFDALVEFPPHGLAGDRVEQNLRWLNPRHGGAVFDYAGVAAAEVKRMQGARSGAVFPGVMPGWDNEARRPAAGAVYHGATPQSYGAWLRAAVARAKRTLSPDRRLVFINAWNEWAEGAYLEPDRAFGRAYLAETARVMSEA